MKKLNFLKQKIYVLIFSLNFSENKNYHNDYNIGTSILIYFCYDEH